uniref:Predicted protein n=1 Tax=Hordeum vulgare subsp. vulgare TaxID=112509 RepID=F2DPR4_HORVV|nr:predicted protein [Hordeum vulgare subsp. vulgare]
MGVLKQLLTRQIQKTIRKLHEATELSEKEKLIDRLGQFKSIGKAGLKTLSYFVMR